MHGGYTLLFGETLCALSSWMPFFSKSDSETSGGFHFLFAFATNATSSIDRFITFCGEENLSCCCRWKMDLTTGWADHCLPQPVTGWLTQFQWFHSQSA